MELLQALRTETRPQHERLEQRLYPRAMAAGTITRQQYAELLGALVWVHRRFEQAVEHYAELAAVWPAEARRATAIERDLQAFGQDCPVEPPEVAQWYERNCAELHPSAAWAGVGYVLEGSRMGGRFLEKSLARALGVGPGQGVGLDYHRDGLDDPSGRWKRVLAAIESLDRSSEHRGTIVSAAAGTFDLMAALHGPEAP
jgi:heme oxygenase